jgi:hypothetical protein
MRVAVLVTARVEWETGNACAERVWNTIKRDEAKYAELEKVITELRSTPENEQPIAKADVTNYVSPL